LADLCGPTALFANIERRDHWGGGELRATDRPGNLGRGAYLDWALRVDGGREVAGTLAVRERSRTRPAAAELAVRVPRVDAVTDGRLLLTFRNASAATVARQE
jgi:hypothetical protein